MSRTSSAIRFILDDQLVELDDVDPTTTLLDHLRYRMRRTGTKEGCAEGDCGACTVLVGELEDQGHVQWRAVNACILFLPMLNGRALLTVESLSRSGQPHPLQSLMAGNNSSQCGFCTPGFVMSLYGRAISGSTLPLPDVLAGNLCRCTGYGPILDAGEATPSAPRDDRALAQALERLRPAEAVRGSHGDRLWFAPRSTAELAEILAEHPDSRIVAGATDVALWVTKDLRDIHKLVFLRDVEELDRIEESDDGVRFGAAVRYADAHAALARLHPDMGELVRRIGGLQIRNSGTIGGNIANGSPIGDGPPALIALGAELTLRNNRGHRVVPIEDYFVDYGKQDRQPGEFLESIWIPRPAPSDVVHISKLSKRFDSDISAVCGAFRLQVTDGHIVGARVAFGGMAATPLRAAACEAALIHAPFSLETMERAGKALRDDYTPISDTRGSAAYRLEAAANLLLRLWFAAQHEPVSVLDARVGYG